jgi:alkylmercury lyase
MTGLTVEAVGQRLAASLCRDDACAVLCTRLVRLLAEGRPVSPDRLAAALGSSRAAVDATLREIPNVEFDDQGDIVAAGISLLPTPHQFQVNGHLLYTWCALDTLLYPVVLQQTTQVASRCPVSGLTLRFTVTPERVVPLEQAGALVSIVVPDAVAACCDVRGAFCQHVHFLAGHDAGVAWRTMHPAALLLSVDDASAVARLLAQTRYRTASSSDDNDT